MEEKKKFITPAFVVKELEVGSILECLYDVYSGKNGGCSDEPRERAFVRKLNNSWAAVVNIDGIMNKRRNECCNGVQREK